MKENWIKLKVINISDYRKRFWERIRIGFSGAGLVFLVGFSMERLGFFKLRFIRFILKY